jgi:hypothetical protein
MDFFEMPVWEEYDGFNLVEDEISSGQIPEKAALDTVVGIPGPTAQELSTTDLLPKEIEVPTPVYITSEKNEEVKIVDNFKSYSHPLLKYMKGF